MSKKENKSHRKSNEDVVKEKVEEIKEEVNESSEVVKLNEELDFLKKTATEQKEKFLRLAAEYDNYRKRSERDKLNIYNDAVANTIKEVLPVLDSLDRAVDFTGGDDENYKKGLKMVYEQFLSSLEKLSITTFGEEGEVFDPEFHYAIAHIEDENLDENVIVEVFQRGYKVSDKVIRHAVVKVAN